MNDDTIDEAQLRRLRDAVSALPKSIEPPANAWGNIRSAIESDRDSNLGAPIEAGAQARASHVPIGSRAQAWWQRPAFLAAAALLLVAGSSAVTAVAISNSSDRNAPVAPSQMAATPREQSNVSSGGPASLAQFTVVESDYLRAVNDLSATLDSERGSLSPETIAKLRESLKIIDAAILEARNALAADPANRTLIRMLSTSYEQKVDLLKRTQEMARS